MTPGGGPAPLLTTLVGAARILGCSRWVVAGMVERRELPIVPVGTTGVHKRIPVAALHKWVEENTIRSAEDEKRVLDRRRRRYKGSDGH